MHPSLCQTSCLWLILSASMAFPIAFGQSADSVSNAANGNLTLEWEENYLTISGTQLPGGELQVHYLEAYCRANSTDADWVKHTVVPHTTNLVDYASDGTSLELKCELADGLIVKHHITSTEDEVRFDITATNPTQERSVAHWAQPCIRLDKFTGCDQESYLAKSFIFVDGRLTRMPFRPWATQARYVPGQVWRPGNVPREDVNPRPLSVIQPSNGLIGCFSSDEKQLFAVAFEPYQELFQGVIVCLHSDFRLGGLLPGETKRILGKMYVLPNDIDLLLARYYRDFPL